MKKIFLVFTLFSFSLVFSQKSQNYLQIGYASICCGPPSTEPVMKYLSQFQKKNKIEDLEIFKQSGLGREGEFSLYIGIDMIPKSQKVFFLKGLHSAIISQNKKRDPSRDGIVNFEGKAAVTKAELITKDNVTIYKK
ncbi:hypothetical protein [Chryseobacterium potabilaquae]|uniref:Uncharacterized protein n=1 Tax=Chryseobacterium potabilaquae TaxID=2675057 RepID=A0A6N4X8X6_9FLAO|nr:hypothetical protein [Chryseobacterium potabilaquae]CAA7197244.1 hypothetical protein CHRY9293_03297 [Chryseobacterium potabilaquae]